METVAVGDIHGNTAALQSVLSQIATGTDPLSAVVFLGDYIDGGPDSKAVIDLLIAFRESHRGEVVFLMGNHEQWLLKSLDDHTKHSWILSMKGLTTVKSYSPELEREFRALMQATGPELISEHRPLPYGRLEQAMPDSHLSFLRSLRLFHETDECICSHAGVSRDFAGAELETQRALLWGSDEFPDYYSGEKLIVYGHFSKKAGFSNGRAVPLETENTICLDTTKHDVISAVVLPERRLIQSASGIQHGQNGQKGRSATERVVVIIDDKDHALKQVIYEFPSVQKNQIVFRHFDTISAFREARVETPYVVFLDFFLSKDRDYGTAIIPELRCTHLVCFSSKKEMSDHMAGLALQQRRDRIANVYSVQKLKGSIGNEELTRALRKIFGSQ